MEPAEGQPLNAWFTAVMICATFTVPVFCGSAAGQEVTAAEPRSMFTIAMISFTVTAAAGRRQQRVDSFSALLRLGWRLAWRFATHRVRRSRAFR